MKTLGKRGALAFYGLEVLVGIFIVMLMFIVLDEAIKSNVIDVGRSLGANNTTMDNLVGVWDAFPWIYIGSSFLLLVMVALARGQ